MVGAPTVVAGGRRAQPDQRHGDPTGPRIGASPAGSPLPTRVAAPHWGVAVTAT
ncbi:hypothetical protein [Micromonospora sp. NPDC003241]